MFVAPARLSNMLERETYPAEGLYGSAEAGAALLATISRWLVLLKALIWTLAERGGTRAG